MEQETPIHFKITFDLQGHSYTTCIGAFIRAFDDKGWQITDVANPPSLSGNIYHHSIPDYLILVEIQPAKKNTCEIHLVSAHEFITHADLENYAALLAREARNQLNHQEPIILETVFKRQLQRFELQFLKEKGATAADESTSFLGWLKQVFFTAHPMQFIGWIITIKVLLFIVMVIDGAGIFDADVDKLIKWGAISKQLVVEESQYWRLLTACFIHSGIVHLFSNMVGLLMASVFLMLILNRWQFLLGYLVTGVLSFAVTVWWNGDIITTGASGAIFGCYGMLIALTATPILSRSDRVTIAIYLAVYVGINLATSFKAGVDTAAHLGGLIAGIAIGIIYYFDLTWQRKAILKPVLHLVVIAVALANCFVLLASSQYQESDLSRLMEKYYSFERVGIQYYSTPRTTPEAEVGLLRQTIFAFENALVTVDSMKAYPGQSFDTRLYTERLHGYTRYRLDALKLRLRVYEEGNEGWNDSINTLEEKADSMIVIIN